MLVPFPFLLETEIWVRKCRLSLWFPFTSSVTLMISLFVYYLKLTESQRVLTQVLVTSVWKRLAPDVTIRGSLPVVGLIGFLWLPDRILLKFCSSLPPLVESSRADLELFPEGIKTGALSGGSQRVSFEITYLIGRVVIVSAPRIHLVAEYLWIFQDPSILWIEIFTETKLLFSRFYD